MADDGNEAVSCKRPSGKRLFRTTYIRASASLRRVMARVAAGQVRRPHTVHPGDNMVQRKTMNRGNK